VHGWFCLMLYMVLMCFWWCENNLRTVLDGFLALHACEQGVLLNTPRRAVGRSKRKALAWARTTATHPPLCFEDSPRRRPLAWARVISPKRDGLAWARPRRALCCSLAQARVGILTVGFLSPKRELLNLSEIDRVCWISARF